jgi:SAM-dependent methyltransferase
VEVEGADIVTWHYGLIARWWANFNVDGPEIEFFRPFVVTGQPTLDVACGTGRLLVPWVAAGLDVDGVDASADMITACAEAAQRVGAVPNLYVQPVHRLDVPRRYGTIVMCGGFGLGGTRQQDLDGLRRMFAHLRPGGRLALDYEVENVAVERWRVSPPGPSQPPAPDRRRRAPDGCDYALAHRVVDIDRPGRAMIRELDAWQWREDQLVAHETHRLVCNVWSRDEIVAALEAVGFGEIKVVGGYHGGAPRGDERFLAYVARRPEAPSG